MSTQQADAEYNETLDYEEPVEQEPIAEIDPTAMHYSSAPQPRQPTTLHPSTAVQEPAVQSPYTPSGSLTLAAQSKITDVNLGGLSMCKIDPLKAGNWISWKTWIHKFFQLFEITDVIHGVELMPEDPISARKWLGKDGVAQALITNNIDDHQMNHVIEATTSAEMWENLQSIHETVGLAGITAAKRCLLNTGADDDTNIVDHINNLREQHNALVNMGERMLDQEFKSTMIMSLPESWDAFMTSYQGSNAKRTRGLQQPQAQISSQELLSILIQEYYCRRRDDPITSNVTYFTHNSGPPKKKKKLNSSSTPKMKCNICGHTNHATKDCCFKGKPKCGKCGMFSHKTEDCRVRRKFGDSKPSYPKQEHANIMRDPQQDEPVASTSYVTKSGNNEPFIFYLWIVDSATTSHITHIKSVFIDYTPTKPIPVLGLGNTHVQAYGCGTVEVITSSSPNTQRILLHDVLYVPDAQDNLLSISRVDHIGGQVQFAHGCAFLIDKNKLTVAEGKLIIRLYVLNFFRKAELSEQANISCSALNGWNEWHKQFGHVGISGLRRLKQANLVNGFNVDTDSPFIECELCIAAKQAHMLFPDHAEPRNTVPGELTYTDIWGPTTTQALNGARYNVVLVDDSSRHLISEQIKTKNEACTRLQNYLTYIERQFSFKPKSVRFDQGKEFLNQKFIDWCADKGIKIEATAPYSPSQNGVAE